jgi:hypothetical protein
MSSVISLSQTNDVSRSPTTRSLVDIEELRRSFGPLAIEPRHKVFEGLV